MEQDTSKKEILDAIHVFSNKVDKQFGAVNKQFREMKTGVDKQFTEIRGDIRGIKNQMVTKDYLDDKLADLRGDLNVMMRKEDRKAMTIVEVLLEKKLINEQDVKRILSLEPFPQG